jgi:hypothetical protein
MPRPGAAVVDLKWLDQVDTSLVQLKRGSFDQIDRSTVDAVKTAIKLGKSDNSRASKV